METLGNFSLWLYNIERGIIDVHEMRQAAA